MKKLITTIVTIVMLGIAPIMTATPAQARAAGRDGGRKPPNPTPTPKSTAKGVDKPSRGD